jgi:hypothetical protein
VAGQEDFVFSALGYVPRAILVQLITVNMKCLMLSRVNIELWVNEYWNVPRVEGFQESMKGEPMGSVEMKLQLFK